MKPQSKQNKVYNSNQPNIKGKNTKIKEEEHSIFFLKPKIAIF